MKQNYHFSGRNPNQIIVGRDPELIKQLFQINAELDQKRKQLNMKQQQQNNLKVQVQFKVMKFYDQHVPTRGTPSNKVEAQQSPKRQEEDFYTKFERNRNQQIERRDKWRRQLQQQVQNSNNNKVITNEELKKRRITDDIMSDQLSGRAKQLVNRPLTTSPKKTFEETRVIQEQLPQQPSKQTSQLKQQQHQLPTNLTSRRGYVPTKEQFVNVFVRDDEQQKARKRQQMIKHYREILEQQIAMEKARKEEEKERKKLQIEFQKELPPARKVVDPNINVRQPIKLQKMTPPQKSMPTANNNENERRLKEKQLSNKYRKGLISWEEYEATLKRLQVWYPEPSTQKSNNINQPSNMVDNQRMIKQEKPCTEVKLDNATIELKSNLNSLYTGRSEYMPSQAINNNPFQPSVAPVSSAQSSTMNTVKPQYNVADLQAFQLEFMKRMFEQMKQLMKTNRILDQQILQDTIQKNMTLTSAMIPQMMPNTPKTVSDRASVPAAAQLLSAAAPVSANQTEMLEESLETDQFKVPYEVSNLKSKSEFPVEEEEFYTKPPKMRAFKSFQYVEPPGLSISEIPGSSVYLTNQCARQELKRLFDFDLAQYQKLQIKKEVYTVKTKQFKKQQLKPDTRQFIPRVQQPINTAPDDKKQSDIVTNPFRKPKQSNNNMPAPSILGLSCRKMQKNKSEVGRMMDECLQQQIPGQDIAEARRELFRNNLLLVARNHNEILEKYEYSQSVIDNESLRIPTIIGQNSKMEQSSVQKTNLLSSKVRSYQWNLRGPSKLMPSNVEEETIQSMEYESIRDASPSKECLQLSRRQLKNMKKLKENVLLDFVVMENSGNGEHFQPKKQDIDQQEIEEQIETRRDSRQYNQHEESTTLVSNYQQSVQKALPLSHLIAPLLRNSPWKQRSSRIEYQFEQKQHQVSYQSKQSNLTSLLEARKRAKQSRSKGKKDSAISIEALERLQREIKKKDDSSSIPLITSQAPQQSSSKSKQKNEKQLLMMLDNMAEDDEDQHYTQQFDSYRSLSRPESHKYKQRF